MPCCDPSAMTLCLPRGTRPPFWEPLPQRSSQMGQLCMWWLWNLTCRKVSTHSLAHSLSHSLTLWGDHARQHAHRRQSEQRSSCSPLADCLQFPVGTDGHVKDLTNFVGQGLCWGPVHMLPERWQLPWEREEVPMDGVLLRPPPPPPRYLIIRLNVQINEGNVGVKGPALRSCARSFPLVRVLSSAEGLFFFSPSRSFSPLLAA